MDYQSQTLEFFQSHGLIDPLSKDWINPVPSHYKQIIEKYMTLFRDSQLSGDRVAAENFQQHAEHYIRLLSEALKEQNDRKEQQEAQAASRRSERTEVPIENLKTDNVGGHDSSVDNDSQISKQNIAKDTDDAEAASQ